MDIVGAGLVPALCVARGTHKGRPYDAFPTSYARA